MNIVEVLFEYVDYIFGGEFRDLRFVYNRRLFAARDAIAEDCVDIARSNRSHTIQELFEQRRGPIGYQNR